MVTTVNPIPGKTHVFLLCKVLNSHPDLLSSETEVQIDTALLPGVAFIVDSAFVYPLEGDKALIKVNLFGVSPNSGHLICHIPGMTFHPNQGSIALIRPEQVGEC